jgi:hypothetical protein
MGHLCGVGKASEIKFPKAPVIEEYLKMVLWKKKC